MPSRHGSSSEKNLEAAEVPPFNKPRATRVPKGEQSMEGMPGYIKTGQGTGGEKLARGHSGIGPHREGPIGEKGRANNEGHIYRDGAGTMEKSYRAASTGKAGHYKMSGEGQPASEAHGDKGKSPMAHARMGDHHLRKPEGHPGRMEKLSGKGKTHAEGRRKSQMY